ncbi:MAG TPA: hypothetical protein VGJ94_00855 [Syntrophorhabdaceae bacterium]|jgi:hypothetical protein
MKPFKILSVNFFLTLLLVSCATPYLHYRDDMFAGRGLLDEGSYKEAREVFVNASREQRRAAAFAFAATASYKMGDLPAAEQFIAEAEAAPYGNYVYARILGYKALTLLGQGRQDEGLAALKAYIDYYKQLYPLMSIEKVEDMYQRRQVNMARLERLIDDEVINYEQEIQQAATTGTGYYATRPPMGIINEGFTIY